VAGCAAAADVVSDGRGRPMREVELLLPAGTPDKVRVAFDFGADAVYLGMKRFSLRSFAGNFDEQELEWAVAYAHERGRKVYVTLNILAMESELAEIAKVVRVLKAVKPDAVIVADPGVLELVRGEASELRVHLSTQSSVTNSSAARFWAGQGVSRIVLARELNLGQIGAISSSGAVDTEVFVHGAQCIAWSGRCFLSLHWAGSGRDPRKGSCAQACRWPYRVLLEDRRRPGESNVLEEDERGTYFFDSKDLCALPLLDSLVASGVRALKVEGRTRSEMYVAVVADVYRCALDLLAAGQVEEYRRRLPEWMAELSTLTERGFSTHFLGGVEPGLEAYNLSGSGLANRNDYLGRVLRLDGDMAELELKNPLAAGELVEFRMPGMRSVVVTATPLLDGVTGESVAMLPNQRRARVWGPGVEVGAVVRRARRAGSELNEV